MMDQLLSLLAALDVKSKDGHVPCAKLTLDKQTYNLVQNRLSGFLIIDSETKSRGLGFTIECGDIA